MYLAPGYTDVAATENVIEDAMYFSVLSRMFELRH